MSPTTTTVRRMGSKLGILDSCNVNNCDACLQWKLTNGKICSGHGVLCL
ncbi:hypothetical protein L914_07062 [Phytophthora nicotianae]|uniref:Uncharacterized protein n=1 Tax=Phytophthora nicotianae TaxID=4792 RepID=W2NL40_PHYNI|nr:hypothetical protein L914_07062 [Phytophthora nicotianae]